MRICFSSDAWDDFLYWQVYDPAMAQKIILLIKEIKRHPFTGTGKPEPLRGQLAGFWSRRITSEHRLVYKISGRGSEQTVDIAACRFHY